MRFFTRQRLMQCQDNIGLNELEQERDCRLEAASQEWEAVNNGYADYLRSIHSNLPEGLKELANTCLHDAVVVYIKSVGDTVEMVLDAKDAPFIAHNGKVCLRFHGVSYHSELSSASLQSLLYDEIFVDGSFYVYNVLLEKTELTVRFREVDLTKQ
jgi:hypothetical protein